MEAMQANGRVIRVTGGEVWVDEGGRTLPCRPRGRMRQDAQARVVAGDRVRVTLPTAGGAGSIEEIEPRVNVFARYVPRIRRSRLVVANVDRLFVVTSLRSPEVRFPFVDRVLASCECGDVPAAIVINKTDLARREAADHVCDVYENCGYSVLKTSAVTGEGIDTLAGELRGGVYAFVGASGVGKSSLINRLDPGLDLPTRGVARRTDRGRHTTTYSQLFPFSGGFLADTPGMQTFGVPCDVPEELGACFPEFSKGADGCRFHHCTHTHEPDCGVRDAVENGRIAPSRLESYVRIFDEIKLRPR